MKLKNILLFTFLLLTIIPIGIISLLLYNGGFSLAKESYTRNLSESIHVQVDYIAKSMENHMTTDYRFANRNVALLTDSTRTKEEVKKELLSQFGSYLESSEDKITSCILIDKNRQPVYSIGEKTDLESIYAQLPALLEVGTQSIVELKLGNDIYSLAILTPILDHDGVFRGSLISVYDRSYIFKIISSYYEITDTATYLCRQNGAVINSRGQMDAQRKAAVEKALSQTTFAKAGVLDTRVDIQPVLGYYKSILNSPWYLVGIIDQAQIYTFLNQFIWQYLVIIGIVFIADLLLAAYFSRKMVRPINDLIQVIDEYPQSLQNADLLDAKKAGYFETRYLRSKFLNLMKTIRRVQHNFEGVYQLYQSGTMGDINIDIDVKLQTIQSNKEQFTRLMHELEVPDEACVVERFIRYFCEKDQELLTKMLEAMRDEHLSVRTDAEVFTSLLGGHWFHALVVPMYEDDRLSRLFIQLRDITSFKKQEQQSLELAARDTLTGLYNRAGFTEHVSDALKSSKTVSAFFFLDIDNFKLVNDNFGHGAGDELLCSIAEDLRRSVGKKGIISRFGGDEFCIFIPDTAEQNPDQLCQELALRLRYPFKNESHSFTISASTGVAICPPDSPKNLQQLLLEADTSMYEAKRIRKQKGRPN